MDIPTIITMAALSMCPMSLLVGAGIGAILAIQLIHRKDRRLHFFTIQEVKPGDVACTIKRYRKDGWNITAITDNAKIGTYDIHLERVA